MIQTIKIASVKNTAKLYQDSFTEWGLRRLIVFRKKNGFDKCIIRIGKKILIDLEEFEKWIKDKRQK
jgi:hypothetical protein